METPAPQVVIANQLSWLQQHERLIIVFMILLVGGWLGSKALDNSLANAKTALAAQQQISQAAASQAALDAKQYQTALDVMSKEITALEASQRARNTVLQQKETVIKTETPTALSLDWEKAIGTSNEIIPSTQGFSVTDDAARKTVAQLEEVPVLTANLADETKIAVGTQASLTQANTVISDQKTEIAQNDKTCKDQISVLKKSSRVSRLRWFGIGVGVGVAAVLHFVI